MYNAIGSHRTTCIQFHAYIYVFMAICQNHVPVPTEVDLLVHTHKHDTAKTGYKAHDTTCLLIGVWYSITVVSNGMQ